MLHIRFVCELVCLGGVVAMAVGEQDVDRRYALRQDALQSAIQVALAHAGVDQDGAVAVDHHIHRIDVIVPDSLHAVAVILHGVEGLQRSVRIVVSRRILLEQPVVDLLILIHGFPAVMRVRGDGARQILVILHGIVAVGLQSSDCVVRALDIDGGIVLCMGYPNREVRQCVECCAVVCIEFGRHTAADRDGRCEFIRMAEDHIPSADAAHGQALDINAALVHLRMRCDEFIQHLQDQRLVVLADPAFPCGRALRGQDINGVFRYAVGFYPSNRALVCNDLREVVAAGFAAAMQEQDQRILAVSVHAIDLDRVVIAVVKGLASLVRSASNLEIVHDAVGDRGVFVFCRLYNAVRRLNFALLGDEIGDVVCICGPAVEAGDRGCIICIEFQRHNIAVDIDIGDGPVAVHVVGTVAIGEGCLDLEVVLGNAVRVDGALIGQVGFHNALALWDDFRNEFHRDVAIRDVIGHLQVVLGQPEGIQVCRHHHAVARRIVGLCRADRCNAILYVFEVHECAVRVRGALFPIREAFAVRVAGLDKVCPIGGHDVAHLMVCVRPVALAFDVVAHGVEHEPQLAGVEGTVEIFIAVADRLRIVRRQIVVEIIHIGIVVFVVGLAILCRDAVFRQAAVAGGAQVHAIGLRLVHRVVSSTVIKLAILPFHSLMERINVHRTVRRARQGGVFIRCAADHDVDAVECAFAGQVNGFLCKYIAVHCIAASCSLQCIINVVLHERGCIHFAELFQGDAFAKGFFNGSLASFFLGFQGRVASRSCISAEAALDDRAVEEAVRQSGGQERRHGHCASGLAANRHVIRVAAEAGDVLLHPFQSLDLVQGAVVAGNAVFAFLAQLGQGQEAKQVHTVLDAHHDDALRRQFGGVELHLGSVAMVIAAAVDPNHDREQLIFRMLRCIDVQIQAIFADFRIISFIKIELVPPELANGVQVFRLHCLVAPFVANAHAVPRLREILRGFPTQFPYRGLCKRDTFINGDALGI